MGRPTFNGGITYDNIVMIGGRDRAIDNGSNRNRDLPFGESTQLLICSGFTSWIYGTGLAEPRIQYAINSIKEDI